jgi:hypothetical protein
MKHHLKHMAIGAAAVLALLLAFGVDLGEALRYAALLACPLGMIAMMAVMGRNNHGHAHGPGTHQSVQGQDHDLSEEPPALGQHDHGDAARI